MFILTVIVAIAQKLLPPIRYVGKLGFKPEKSIPIAVHIAGAPGTSNTKLKHNVQCF